MDIVFEDTEPLKDDGSEQYGNYVRQCPMHLPRTTTPTRTRIAFIFEQTTPGNIGAVTVNQFDPDKDIFTFSSQLTTSVSYHDNA